MELSNNFYICLYILLLSIISFTLYKRNTKPLRRLTEESLKLLRGRDHRRRRDIYQYGSLYGNIKEGYGKKKRKNRVSHLVVLVVLVVQVLARNMYKLMDAELELVIGVHL